RATALTDAAPQVRRTRLVAGEERREAPLPPRAVPLSTSTASHRREPHPSPAFTHRPGPSSTPPLPAPVPTPGATRALGPPNRSARRRRPASRCEEGRQARPPLHRTPDS